MTAFLPIHDRDAERDLIATSLDVDGAFDEASEILRSPDDIYDADLRALWQACTASLARFGRVDATGVETAVKDAAGPDKRATAIRSLASVISDGAIVFPVSRVATRVRDLARLRAVRSLGQEMGAVADQHTADPQSWIDVVEQRIFDVAHVVETQETWSDAKDAVTDMVRAKAEALAAGAVMTGTPTGIAGLDALTHGLHDQQLIIVAGATSMGKSALASCIAVNVAALDRKRRGVAYFTLEMSREETIERMVVSEARLDLTNVRGCVFAGGDWGIFENAASWVGGLAMYIDDKAAIAPAQLRARTRRAASRFARQGVDLALVVVDYVQLMTPPERGLQREQQVASCTRALKALAKEMRVPVIALAQINRAAEKNEGSRPNLSNLRESGAVEQDADVVIFVHREGYYRKEDDGLAELIVAKQRSGPRNKTVDVAFHESSTRFDNLDPEGKRRAIASREQQRPTTARRWAPRTQ